MDVTLKRKSENLLEQKKKKKKRELSIICKCTEPLKTTTSAIPVNVYTCIHACKKYGFYYGDRIRYRDKGYGYIMGVGLVGKSDTTSTALFISFDNSIGTIIISVFVINGFVRMLVHL